MPIGTTALSFRTWVRDVLHVPGVVVDHTIAGVSVLVAGALVHYVLHLLGDPLLFEIVPWAYVVDCGDLAIFVAIVFNAVRGIVRGGR